jgi:hypothetical protein
MAMRERTRSTAERTTREDARTDDRGRYGWLRAAQRGDAGAFRRLCDDMRDPLADAVRRALVAEGMTASDSRVREYLEDVCTSAFHELPDKPDDWSVYGWLTWIVRREVMAKPHGRGAPPAAGRAARDR